MDYDKTKDIQLLHLSGIDYVLVQKEKYEQLLDKLEAMDTTLDIARSRFEGSRDILRSLLKKDFSVEQISEVARSKSLGGRIRLLRQFCQLDQRELAEKAGVSQTTISNLENDKVGEPSFQSLDQIFHGLGIPEAAVYPLLKKAE